MRQSTFREMYHLAPFRESAQANMASYEQREEIPQFEPFSIRDCRDLPRQWKLFTKRLLQPAGRVLLFPQFQESLDRLDECKSLAPQVGISLLNRFSLNRSNIYVCMSQNNHALQQPDILPNSEALTPVITESRWLRSTAGRKQAFLTGFEGITSWDLRGSGMPQGLDRNRFL